MNKCENCEDRPKQLEKLDIAIQKAKPYSIVLIILVIIAGILIIFACSIFKNEIPGLEEMNQFVGIVLGVVATIVSVVSMLISFYGLEKTEESERRQREILQQIIDIEKETKRSAEEIERRVRTGLDGSNLINKDNSDLQGKVQMDQDAI